MAVGGRRQGKQEAFLSWTHSSWIWQNEESIAYNSLSFWHMKKVSAHCDNVRWMVNISFPGLGIQALDLRPHRATPFLPSNSAESYDSNFVLTQQTYRLLSWKVERKQALLTWLCSVFSASQRLIPELKDHSTTWSELYSGIFFLIFFFQLPHVP